MHALIARIKNQPSGWFCMKRTASENLKKIADSLLFGVQAGLLI
jgi:hypothetical protein